MEKMTLARVAALIGSGATTDFPDTVVEGLSADSRNLPKGSLFVPLVGARFDGHDYIDSAYALGAAAAITHKNYCGSCPTVRVYDTMSALTALAAGYRASFSPIVVGITGSVGKTTTKELTAAVMAKKYFTHKTQGNKNNEIGLPLTLMQLESGHGAAVIEMGMSDFGEISRLSRLARPDIAVITNVGTSHIEFLGSREGIARAKSEIADGMSDGADIIKSRIGLMRHAQIITPEQDIVDEYRKVGSFDVIIADEAQFMTPEQIDQLRYLVDFENVPVLCFGLRTDFLTHFFPGARRLMELADSITEIKTVCECGHKATVNARIDEQGRVVTEGSQIMLGGNDSYIAMCHRCWRKKIAEQV